MELYKRTGQPAWYVDMVHPVTKRRVRKSTGQHTKRLAEKVANKLLADLEQEDDRAITIAAATQEYADHLKASKKASWPQVQALRDKMLGLSTTGRFAIDGDRRLHTLEPLDMAKLVRARRAEGNGAQTIAHELKMLRAATRHVAGLGFRCPEMAVNASLKNPWQMPKLTMKTRYLSWAEWSAVYAALSPSTPVEQRGVLYLLGGSRAVQRQDAQDLFVALTLTGGRWAEVAGLTWDRIDVPGMDRIRLWGSKGQKERLVPVPEQVQVVLKRRYAARTASEGGLTAQTLVFPGRLGEMRSGGCRAILRAFEACHLNATEIVAVHGRATVHSLRHTFASWLVQNGAGLGEVKDALGHTTLAMTTRYAHLAQQENANRLAGVLDRIGKGTPTAQGS